jgi:acetoin utilization deacetylase AcuC-like enzyme
MSRERADPRSLTAPADPTVGALLRAARRFRFTGRRARARLAFSQRYVLDVPATSIDPLRGERVLTWLDAQGFFDRRDQIHPRPASLRALRRVHSDAYLESLREPAALEPILGFGDSRELLDAIVVMQRAMVGGTLAVAERALTGGGKPAVNVGGGFHHAGAARGAGFCVFNDIAVAIAEQRARGFSGNVLVVDLDLHDGEGTRSIFAEDPTVFTLSLHNHHRGPTEAVASLAVEYGTAVEDREYLALVERHLPEVFARHEPQLVIYLAGVDPAADDRLGDGKLTSEGLDRRDARVLELCGAGARSRPLAIVLGGGYGAQAWRHSARFLARLLAGARVEPGEGVDVALLRYRQLQGSLAAEELALTGDSARSTAGTDDWSLTAEDLMNDLSPVTVENRFLGYYSETGLELALEQAGLLDRLRALGFPNLEVALDTTPGAGQTARIWGTPGRRDLLIELRVRRDRASAPGFELVRVEWMLLQNPRLSFRAETRPLAGQRHPGLGMGEDVLLLLVIACERLALDGIVYVPSHLRLVAKGGARSRFLEPRAQREYDALMRLFGGRDRELAERALAAGHVLRADGSPFAWTPRPMIIPVSARFAARLEADGAALAQELRRTGESFDLHFAGEPVNFAQPSP